MSVATPFNARRWLVLLAAVAGVATTVSLGYWQLRRADQKLAMAAQAAQRQTEAPWTNADWPCATSGTPANTTPGSASVDLPEQRPVWLHGHWMTDKVVYLDNRVMSDRAGFYVLTPLLLDPAPACGPAWVVVQRGWAPRNQVDRLKLPDVSTPKGEVVVQGHVVREVSRTYQLGQEPVLTHQSEGPLLRQNVSRADWQAWVGTAPATGAVLQTDLPGAATGDLLRNWPPLDAGVGKHQAYAAQWFAMALIITGLYVWFQLLRPRRAS